MTDIILTISLILAIIIFYLILSKREKEKIEFFHVMAHRFRSPISLIKWYVELLTDKSVGDLNEKQKGYFKEIYNASEKLNKTIDSLIVLLQLQSKYYVPKSDDVDIRNIIELILESLTLKIKRHSLEVIKEYPENQKLIIKSDPRLVTVALENLIENAVRFSPEKSKIEIKVLLEAKHLTVQIKDYGCGIPKNKKVKILAESVSSKDMGFSLYMVKLIIKNLNSKIRFISEENKGTTFFVSFPSDLKSINS